jgi:hypothetical protein
LDFGFWILDSRAAGPAAFSFHSRPTSCFAQLKNQRPQPIASQIELRRAVLQSKIQNPKSKIPIAGAFD